MSIAIGIGTMLLGGWVLNTPVEEQAGVGPEGSPAPSAAFANPSRGMGDQNIERAIPRDQAQQQLRQQNRLQGRQPNAPTPGMLPGAQLARPSGQQAGQPVPGAIPSAPTDSLAGAAGVMPMSPTASQDELDANAAAAKSAALTAPQPGNPLGAYMPEMPTSRRAYSPRTSNAPSTYDTASYQRMQTQRSSHPSPAVGPAPEKAFSSYRPYSSGVSPYMALFRNDTAGGTIDNYTTFVRPALDQRSMNQQFNMDLYGLERNARLQNAAMRQMGQGASRTLQSVGTPQYERNYGNYYPGFGQGSYSGRDSY